MRTLWNLTKAVIFATGAYAWILASYRVFCDKSEETTE